ncbi:C40 family peptidase [Paenibacillus eucommiae]|uniref:Cell wall-associated NlpC family hydrolase n=1 Tax=Paenibacillus eucommiae TaxID=1355755 RepID=A0ABS4IY06_9BACL|nr:C40 family peptidase [Paenibacillus eucommiae]MBP1991766.1 cell wall-associated NlpC family hydrolase [Paenibacillus eucommiae]
MGLKLKFPKRFLFLSFCMALSLLLSVSVVPPAAQAAATSAQQKSVIDMGKRFLGTPYEWGAKSGSTRTFDCSSFTQYIFKKHGINLARGARGQSENGTKISRKNLRVGDLVFFSTRATMKYSSSSIKRIGHVGIYAGNNKVLHTFGKGGVKFSDMGSGWWDDHYVSAVRVLK